MRYFILFFFIGSACVLQAKNYNVSVTLGGFSYKKVFVLRLYGDKASVKDTIMTNANGTATCVFSDKDNTGLYQFAFNDDNYIDFIFNKEDIKIETSIYDYFKNIKIVESIENEVYYSFLRKQALLSKKMDVLTYVSDNYPDKGMYYKLTIKEFAENQQILSDFIDSLLQRSEKMFVYKLINAKRELAISPDIPQIERLEYYKSHYFDYIDFADTTLFYSDALTHKLISYLSFWSSRYIQPEQQELLFKQALDTIINKSVNYPNTYNFVLNYLINGFESMNMFNLVEYLADSYLSLNSCEDKSNRTTLERKVLYHKKLAIGESVPDFSVNMNDGKIVGLKDYGDKYLILFFWSTHCQHCIETFPTVKKIVDVLPVEKAELLAISLDENKKGVQNFLKEIHYNHANVACDGKGWDSQIVEDYYIYATPTIVVVKNGVVVQKPLEINKLIDFLGTKGVL